jgi:hypothetical protein
MRINFFSLFGSDFKNIPLDKTCEEIYSLYKKAYGFIEYIETKFNSYSKLYSKGEEQTR